MVEGGGDSGGVILPSLLSPLFFRYLLFFSSVSSWLSAAVGDAGGGGLGEWLGRWSAFLPLLLCVFL